MARPDAFREMLSFEGRIRRLDWWLTIIGFGFLSGLISVIVRIILGDPDGTGAASATVQAALIILFNVAFTWPLLAASVKRSHDRGESGALPLANLILAWLPVVLAIVAPDALKTPPLLWLLVGLFAVNFLLGVWLLITLGFLDGTHGANQYGTSPKGAGDRNYHAPRAD